MTAVTGLDAPPAAPTAADVLPATPWRTTLGSEWTKFAAQRANRVIFAVGILLGVGVAALVCFAIGATWEDWNAADRAEFDPVLVPLIGSIFSAVLFVVLGVKVGASEYATGMIRLTLWATPKRGRVLAAKAVVVAVASWLGGFVSTFAMIALGQAVLGAYDVPTAGLGDGDVVRVLLAGTLLAPLFPLVGLALGIVLRGTAGAVTTVLALIFAPAVLGELLPQWWRENVLALLPGPASDSVILSHLDAADWYLSPGLGTVAVAVWLVVFLGGGYLALTRRDA